LTIQSPVSETGTLALMLAGLVALSHVVRRQRLAQTSAAAHKC
jgi:hypothetical protein